ncbi:carbamoyltransferase C-terminal domain-containing protein [Kitasatospora sp. NPDC001132]
MSEGLRRAGESVDHSAEGLRSRRSSAPGRAGGAGGNGPWELTPAAVHTGGILRPQTVARDDTNPYARLLASFAEQTGRPPSFNHEAEPIVCMPRDAVATFAAGPLDRLAIGPFLVSEDGLN